MRIYFLYSYINKYKSMSLLKFMELNAKSKGIYKCPNCNTEDIFFSLNIQCDNCSSPIPEKPKLLKLQFSIEVLIYFINNFDEMMPEGETKRLYLNGGKKIIDILKETNSTSLSKDEFKKFQHVTGLIPALGGNRFEGSINLIPPSFNLLESCSSPLTVGKSLATIYWAVEYINKYKI